MTCIDHRRDLFPAYLMHNAEDVSFYKGGSQKSQVIERILIRGVKPEIEIPSQRSKLTGESLGRGFLTANLLKLLVPKGGFEPPRGSPTTPSRWRVYQFHHFGIFSNINNLLQRFRSFLFRWLRGRCLRRSRPFWRRGRSRFLSWFLPDDR